MFFAFFILYIVYRDLVPAGFTYCMYYYFRDCMSTRDSMWPPSFPISWSNWLEHYFWHTNRANSDTTILQELFDNWDCELHEWLKIRTYNWQMLVYWACGQTTGPLFSVGLWLLLYASFNQPMHQWHRCWGLRNLILYRGCLPFYLLFNAWLAINHTFVNMKLRLTLNLVTGLLEHHVACSRRCIVFFSVLACILLIFPVLSIRRNKYNEGGGGNGKTCKIEKGWLSIRVGRSWSWVVSYFDAADHPSRIDTDPDEVGDKIDDVDKIDTDMLRLKNLKLAAIAHVFLFLGFATLAGMLSTRLIFFVYTGLDDYEWNKLFQTGCTSEDCY